MQSEGRNISPLKFNSLKAEVLSMLPFFASLNNACYMIINHLTNIYGFFAMSQILLLAVKITQ